MGYSLRAISVSTDRNRRKCCSDWRRLVRTCIRGNTDRYLSDIGADEDFDPGEAGTDRVDATGDRRTLDLMAQGASLCVAHR